MAKSKEAKTEESSDLAPAVEDVKLAVRAVMDITGCGEPAAKDRVGSMQPSMVAKIARLEREDKRVDIVTLLY